MGFVYEKIPADEIEFVKSMGLKSCWGSGTFYFSSEHIHWSVNREKQAYLIGIGGGMHDVPHTFDLWWEGSIVRIEYDKRGTTGSGVIGVNLVWHINRIIVPKDLWDKRDEVVELIRQGFSVIYWATEKEKTKSITVKIACQPELATKWDAYGY